MMHVLRVRPSRLLCAALLCLFAFQAKGQQPTPTPTPQTPPQQQQEQQPDEVLRISTELVQTDVMVFDSQGRFVDNLKPEQFQLKVDGKPQPITFFERVAAGSVNEELQLAAARGTASSANVKGATVKPLDRGRTVLFFLDDLHMSFQSLETARKSLLRFIDDEMGQNDLAAITSASGRIGFLQQFTDNKAVLRAAVARLKYQPYSVTSSERPPMTEYQALAIERNDLDALGYFIDQIQRDFPGSRQVAETMVRQRARAILSQANHVTTNTLASLDGLVRSTSRLPGRKLLFFLSDGFFLDQRNGNPQDRLRRITDMAARAGVVIYALDTRGLTTGMPDASSDVAFDTSGRLSRVNGGELSASQEALFTLAGETGGRAMINSNAPASQLRQALSETAVYYLLVWRPEQTEQQRGGAKYRKLEVSVPGHPEYKVRARRGFFNEEAVNAAARNEKDKGREKAQPAAAKPRSTDEELRAAIAEVYPRGAIPTALSVSYMDLPEKGPLLMLSVQVGSQSLSFNKETAKQTALLNLAGVVINDEGKQVHGFKDQLTVTAPLAEKEALPHREIIYSHQTPLAPGLYQVRAAVQDQQSGQTGSAVGWIEIPNLSAKRLALSSIFIGERKKDQEISKAAEATPLQVELKVDGRFASTSQLRFLTIIYNASRGPANTQTPDVALQIQIFRDNQPVLTNALRKVQTEGFSDLTRLPYAAEIPLNEMRPGRYVLQVTVIDRIAKATTSQRVSFTVE